MIWLHRVICNCPWYRCSMHFVAASERTVYSTHTSLGSRATNASSCSSVPTGRVGWGGGFVQLPPPPNFRRTTKIVPNSTRFWKMLKTVEFRTPTPQDVQKKGSKISKLPPVRNCFTLAMTNKLVVIINSLKVPKIKKMFTVWHEISCIKLQLPSEPLTRGLPPPDPRSLWPLSSTEFVEPPPRNKIPGYATAHKTGILTVECCSRMWGWLFFTVGCDICRTGGAGWLLYSNS